MSKITHYDLFGEELEKNDLVIAADGLHGQLKICRILRHTPKMVRLEEVSSNRYRRTFLRYSRYLIKIETDKAAEYVLTLG